MKISSRYISCPIHNGATKAWSKVTGRAVDLDGITTAVVHRAIVDPKLWTVSDPKTGAAFKTAKTARAAAEATLSILQRHPEISGDPERFKVWLAKQAAAMPTLTVPVESLPDYVWPAPKDDVKCPAPPVRSPLPPGGLLPVGTLVRASAACVRRARDYMLGCSPRQKEGARVALEKLQYERGVIVDVRPAKDHLSSDGYTIKFPGNVTVCSLAYRYRAAEDQTPTPELQAILSEIQTPHPPRTGIIP